MAATPDKNALMCSSGEALLTGDWPVLNRTERTFGR